MNADARGLILAYVAAFIIVVCAAIAGAIGG